MSNYSLLSMNEIDAIEIQFDSYENIDLRYSELIKYIQLHEDSQKFNIGR